MIIGWEKRRKCFRRADKRGSFFSRADQKKSMTEVELNPKGGGGAYSQGREMERRRDGPQDVRHLETSICTGQSVSPYVLSLADTPSASGEK